METAVEPEGERHVPEAERQEVTTPTDDLEDAQAREVLAEENEKVEEEVLEHHATTEAPVQAPPALPPHAVAPTEAPMVAEIESEVQQAGGHLATSTELGVTLSWDGPVDLDLYLDPPGNHDHPVYWNNKKPPGTNAKLDVDMMSSCRYSGGTRDCRKVENLFVKSPEPAGEYRFYVKYVLASCL